MRARPEIEDILKDIDSLISAAKLSSPEQPLRSRIRCALESLVALELSPDTGPWSVSQGGRLVSSDNFDHDVVLKVNGDFYSDESRRAYSLKLAEALTGLPKEPPAGLLESMATCLRHDFGLDRDPDQTIGSGFTADERASMLRDMRKLYEEVQGSGFYKGRDTK